MSVIGMVVSAWVAAIGCRVIDSDSTPPWLSQRESQVGAVEVDRCCGGLGFAAPHPSRLRRATFPRGGRLWCGGTGGGVRENPPGRRGHAPRPTKGTSLLLRLLSCNEPGDPLRWWSITRVAGTPLTAAARRLPLSVTFGDSSPRGRAKWVRWKSIGAVVDWGSLPLIRHGFAVPPSPEGEGFGAVELWRCGGKTTGAAGACPRPTKGTSLLIRLLSCNEPGDPQRWWSTTRVTVS